MAESSSARATIIRLGKTFVRAMVSPLVASRPAFRTTTERHGSGIGGWTICPDRIGAGAIVYSVGLGKDISFDLSLIRTRGVVVHGFDPTPQSASWVRAQALPSAFRFHEIGLGARDGTARFAAPLLPGSANYSLVVPGSDRSSPVDGRIMRVGSIMRMLGHSRIDLLKMDIEGAEYEVIDDIASTRPDIGQILLEFHHRHLDDGLRRTRRAIASLEACGYRLFWVSWRGVEYGFLRT